MESFPGNGAIPPPLVAGVGVFSWVLDDITGIDPTPLPPADKARLLLEVSRLVERLQGFRLSLITASEEVARTDGSPDLASWLAPRLNVDDDEAYADQALARALDSRWRRVAVALRDGDCTLEQARVIVRVLEGISRGHPEGQVVRAELALVTAAAQHPPRELRRIGEELLEELALVEPNESAGPAPPARRAG